MPPPRRPFGPQNVHSRHSQTGLSIHAVYSLARLTSDGNEGETEIKGVVLEAPEGFVGVWVIESDPGVTHTVVVDVTYCRNRRRSNTKCDRTLGRGKGHHPT